MTILRCLKIDYLTPALERRLSQIARAPEPLIFVKQKKKGMASCFLGDEMVLPRAVVERLATLGLIQPRDFPLVTVIAYQVSELGRAALAWRAWRRSGRRSQ